MIRLDPLTLKKLKRFRSIKRGWWSAVGLAVAILLSMGSELFVSNRALLVRHEGRLSMPTYGSVIPGKTFGLDYDHETDYRELKKVLGESGKGFVVLPPRLRRPSAISSGPTLRAATCWRGSSTVSARPSPSR